jgi:hypothetical protein
MQNLGKTFSQPSLANAPKPVIPVNLQSAPTVLDFNPQELARQFSLNLHSTFSLSFSLFLLSVIFLFRLFCLFLDTFRRLSCGKLMSKICDMVQSEPSLFSAAIPELESLIRNFDSVFSPSFTLSLFMLYLVLCRYFLSTL